VEPPAVVLGAALTPEEFKEEAIEAAPQHYSTPLTTELTVDQNKAHVAALRVHGGIAISSAPSYEAAGARLVTIAVNFES
jgi:hypothetical protein